MGDTYLFGDSVDSSLQFNVLECVRDLVACVGHIGPLYAEVEGYREELEAFVRARRDLIDELEHFSNAAVNDLEVLAGSCRRPELTEYGSAVGQLVDEALERARQVHIQACEEARARIQTEIESRTDQVRQRLVNFLEHARFPAEDERQQLWLEAARMHGRVRCEIAPGVEAEFALPLAEHQWSGPRRVSEFVRGLELEVGLRRGLLRRKPRPERKRLDDYVIARVEARAESVAIDLAKKASAPPSIRITMREVSGVVRATAHRLDADDSAARTASGNDLGQVEKLWLALQQELGQLWERRTLHTLRLDGKEPAGAEALVGVFERLVIQLRPVVRDLVAHGSNDHELALKVDRGDERRVELYIRRSELSRHYEGLTKSLALRLGFVELLPDGALERGSNLSVLRPQSIEPPPIPLAAIRRRRRQNNTDRYRSVSAEVVLELDSDDVIVSAG